MSHKANDIYLETMTEQYKESVSWGKKDNIQKILKSLRENNYHEQADELMRKTSIELLTTPSPVENDWPTQEEVNGGFAGINSGNHE